jgi:catechol 2,3-dioxygenase-like lactoylglutathione lyase family enzyme
VRISGINHFTIRCHPSELPELKEFYRAVLGMSPGPRPDFDFPGYWMYADDRALLHLAGNQPTVSSIPPTRKNSGFDHVSFRTHGLERTRERLAQLGVSFYELPVPGYPLHQVFLMDPAGTKLELTFEVIK